MAADLTAKPGTGPHRFLDGKPIRDGEVLELQLPGGQWLWGHYEWDEEAGAPFFCFQIDGGWQHASPPNPAVEMRARLPPEAVLRRPDWRNKPQPGCPLKAQAT